MTAATSAAPPPSGARAEHDGAEPVLVAQGEGDVAERVALEAVDALDDDAVDGLGGERRRLVAGRLALERLDLVAQRLDLLEALASAVDHLADRAR